MNNNLILIGMPGVGKSTIGVQLAKQLGLDFLDTDLLLQRQTALRLQQFINLKGLHNFRAAEAEMLIKLDCTDTVVATGGSVIYSAPGMAHLKSLGTLIYLRLDLQSLTQRIADMGQRGLLKQANQSFADLYAERTPLYHKYADLEIDTGQHIPATVLHKLENLLKTR